MKNFDLNIDRILENWEVFHAIRELLANAIDEHVLTNTAKPEIVQDEAGWWHIRDFGRGLRYQDLIQTENPEKLENPNVIGKFGIGLKDALATFERRGIQVCIRSRHGDISLARISKHSFEELVTLHATITEPFDSEMLGTDCCLYGVSDSDMLAAKRLFLAFGNLEPIETTRFGDVYSEDSASGIYINGMKVAEENNFLFTYNVTSLNAAIKKALNRERQNLGRSAYSERLRNILLSCQSEVVLNAISDDLQRYPKGEAHDELSWLEVQEHAVRILNTKSRVLFISSTDAVRRPDLIDSAMSSGFRVLTVPENLAHKIDGIKDLTGQPVTAVNEFIRQEHASFEFKWVSEAELSTSEILVWQQTERILDLMGGRPAAVKDIRISETLRSGPLDAPETVGLWVRDKQWIIIKREVLETLESYAGVLMHEALHAKFLLGDVSRAFEYELTKLCGKVTALLLTVTSDGVSCKSRSLESNAPNHPVRLKSESIQTQKIEALVVGIRYHRGGADGVAVGDNLQLIREPFNKFDSNAIKVNLQSGETLGYVAKEYVLVIAKQMDAGMCAEAQVLRLIGNTVYVAVTIGT